MNYVLNIPFNVPLAKLMILLSHLHKTTKNDMEKLNFNFVNLLLLNYGNKLNQCKCIFKENLP